MSAIQHIATGSLGKVWSCVIGSVSVCPAMTTMNPTELRGPSPPARVIAVDVLRGLVIFLLIPDLLGGFSFYKMAALYPDNAIWGWLGQQFHHVPWSGAAIWDFVMPVFIFLVGVAIPYSYQNRRARGDSHGQLLIHAIIRAVALCLLGLLIQYEPYCRLEELLPFLILFLGLPLTEWSQRYLGIADKAKAYRYYNLLSVLILSAVGIWMWQHYVQLHQYNFNQILTQIGLAYLAAFLLVRQRPVVQFAVAMIILAAHGAAFALFVPPPALHQADAAFTGYFAHWNNGDNLAAVFDLWFMNLWPRAEPYVVNKHHTLVIIPLISSMLFGMLVARHIMSTHDKRKLVYQLHAVALSAIMSGWLMSLSIFPLVKLMNTPSWIILSTGVALFLLAMMYWLCDVSGQTRWAIPFIVLGTNSVLLYFLASTQRWRITKILGKFVEEEVLSRDPVMESLFVLGTFWILALVLYRVGVFIRL